MGDACIAFYSWPELKINSAFKIEEEQTFNVILQLTIQLSEVCAKNVVNCIVANPHLCTLISYLKGKI